MIPSFKVGSKPAITAEAYQEVVNKQGGKFIKDPGTYGLMIKSAKWETEQAPVDSTWANAKFEFENVDGQSIGTWVRVPTTADGNFMYGPKKSVYEFQGLQKFLRGFGVVLDFDNAMSQIAELFGDIENFVGKSITARVGYKGTWLKYLGKSEDGNNRYQWTKPDGTPKDETIFPDYKAAEAYAAENKVKTSGFANILEYYVPKEPTIVLGQVAASEETDLPF